MNIQTCQICMTMSQGPEEIQWINGRPHQNDCHKGRRRSRAISIKSHVCSQCSHENSFSSQEMPSYEHAVYDLATWRMYNRIVNFRRKQMNRAGKCTGRNVVDKRHIAAHPRPTQIEEDSNTLFTVNDALHSSYIPEEGIFELDLWFIVTREDHQVLIDCKY